MSNYSSGSNNPPPSLDTPSLIPPKPINPPNCLVSSTEEKAKMNSAKFSCHSFCCDREEERHNKDYQENAEENKMGTDDSKESQLIDLFPFQEQEALEDPLCPEFMKSDWNGFPAKDIQYFTEDIDKENCMSLGINQTSNPNTEQKEENKENSSGQDLKRQDSRKKENNKIPRRKLFSQNEDEKLIELVKQYGKGNWILIASKMPGRDRKQVCERYTNYLERSRTDKDFTPAEDVIIIDYVQRHGNKWADIEKLLNGRSRIDIKNRYFGNLCRNINKVPANILMAQINQNINGSTLGGKEENKINNIDIQRNCFKGDGEHKMLLEQRGKLQESLEALNKYLKENYREENEEIS